MTKKLEAPRSKKEAKPPLGKRIRAFLRRNCVPTLVEDIIDIRKRKKAGEDVGKRPYLRAVGKNLARVGASAGVQFGSAYSFGVLAWQTKPGAPTTESLENSSPVATAFATAVTTAIPPDKREMWANILLGADMALSAIRIWVEQRLWRRYKVTPDFPGTLVSPLVIGAGEMAYKTAALAQVPDDAGRRLVQGIKGVYGNVVRFAMAGLIFVAGKIHDRYSNRPSEGKNEKN